MGGLWLEWPYKRGDYFTKYGMKCQKMSHNNKYTHDFGKAIQITKHYSCQSSELEFETDETM